MSRSFLRNHGNYIPYWSLGLLASRGDDVRQSESIENEGPRVLPITRNVTVEPKDWGHVIQGGSLGSFLRQVHAPSSPFFS